METSKNILSNLKLSSSVFLFPPHLLGLLTYFQVLL